MGRAAGRDRCRRRRAARRRDRRGSRRAARRDCPLRARRSHSIGTRDRRMPCAAPRRCLRRAGADAAGPTCRQPCASPRRLRSAR
ncbi:hypothetical protein F1C10_09170 [Sphingomonas sp. NBWT7]|nr:hypothetical protein F1C10_09170 [Sphingomonas sp. NBWT7]